MPYFDEVYDFMTQLKHPFLGGEEGFYHSRFFAVATDDFRWEKGKQADVRTIFLVGNTDGLGVACQAIRNLHLQLSYTMKR